jgi:hypothetical protein
MSGTGDRWRLRESYTFDRHVIAEIHRAANTGVYRIRGWGAKRKMPTLDDLVFLGASMSRYPLEGYRESCETNLVIGAERAARPLEIAIPITIAGMSFGSLSANAKEALGRGASAMGTSTTSGDGGMLPEEREHSSKLIYQYLPSRYGQNPDDLRSADAIEVVVGQGAKPGGGGILLGQKVSERVAGMRTLPAGWTAAFDSVTLTLSEFGCFDDESDNQLVLAETRRVLRDGGRFLLDIVVNRDELILNGDRNSSFDGGGFFIVDRGRLDIPSGIFSREFQWYRQGQLQEETWQIRAYTAPEVSRMLEQAGFRESAGYRNYAGDSLTRDSAGMVFLAQK